MLSAAGHRAGRRQAGPAGLTGREVEVLRLLARGLSNKEIGEHLVISRKTAAHHVEHIYAKTGTTNRALASLFAANHGLIGESPVPDADGPGGRDVTLPVSGLPGNLPGTPGNQNTGPSSR